MTDMAGAILDVAVADILEGSDDALVVDACFGTEDRQLGGTFLVLPSPELRRVLLQQGKTPYDSYRRIDRCWPGRGNGRRRGCWR